jgi:hypothetical protein
MSAKANLVLYELKQHKPWFGKKVYIFLDPYKQADMPWLQDPNPSNIDNINNVRCEASRHFRNKNEDSLKAKIDELETNSKFKNV